MSFVTIYELFSNSYVERIALFGFVYFALFWVANYAISSILTFHYTSTLFILFQIYIFYITSLDFRFKLSISIFTRMINRFHFASWRNSKKIGIKSVILFNCTNQTWTVTQIKKIIAQHEKICRIRPNCSCNLINEWDINII